MSPTASVSEPSWNSAFDHSRRSFSAVTAAATVRGPSRKSLVSPSVPIWAIITLMPTTTPPTIGT